MHRFCHDVELLLLDEEKLSPQFLDDTALAVAPPRSFPKSPAVGSDAASGPTKFSSRSGRAAWAKCIRAVRDDDSTSKKSR